VWEAPRPRRRVRAPRRRLLRRDQQPREPSVPHLHVHIIPRRKKDGLKGFFWPRVPYSGKDEMERVRAAIAAEMQP
jgi:diadenosine tetraphosphate (Ap4A) HIT family hydrolase